MRLALFLLLPTLLRAGTITVGSTDAALRTAFGIDVNAGVLPQYPVDRPWQELYDHTVFPNQPVTITGLAYMTDRFFHTGSGPVTINVTVLLGTAATTFSAPSITFANNRGADSTVVFNGQITFTPQFNGTFDLIIPISPFTYNPSQGDLLVDYHINAITAGNYTQLLYEGGTSTASSRVYIAAAFQTTNGAIAINSGTYTQFTITNTPEPTTTIPAILLLAILLRARRRRQ